MSDTEDVVMDSSAEEPVHISPIANPLLRGKTLKRSLKLVKRALALEKLAKAKRLEEEGEADTILTRLVKRGVQDVTKAIRKGIQGVVLVACDVHPIDVVAHLPIMCEDASVAYAYVSSKRVMSQVCQSKRPTCVVLVTKPPKDLLQRLTKLVPDRNEKLNYTDLYEKVDRAIRNSHPFM
ncbi:ribosomal protein L7Ae-related protein, putative [Babesia bigemina]|uniref:Ribosomal protein L7Ae-related protein, putative n=1 Tax=Babesia bigemina TaxID=5866 RepID=A0A061D3W9_BABBI|nr:ribosomal protein L7Ae-related protein, putative [Babesia bigemina]CDR95263.1 ribosomal protein L7Ae-related protein, putative [Babesia bigemina]|eukprot:XP_012767449.1 ribosomal protein L7Ae-related protein, putative [Babesia bigemina]